MKKIRTYIYIIASATLIIASFMHPQYAEQIIKALNHLIREEQCFIE